MANREHVEHLQQGIISWNAWRDKNPGEQPDLSFADFRWIDLSRDHLNAPYMRKAFLGRVVKPETNLHRG